MAQYLTYTQCSDYYIPDIRLAHTETQSLGKYGRMRRVFLEQNKPMLFNDMVLTETLFPHKKMISANAETISNKTFFIFSLSTWQGALNIRVETGIFVHA